jgi:hypothetical protein
VRYVDSPFRRARRASPHGPRLVDVTILRKTERCCIHLKLPVLFESEKECFAYYYNRNAAPMSSSGFISLH